MKSPETMTRAELIAYAHDLKRMVAGLQKQLTKALDALAKEQTKRMEAAKITQSDAA